MERTEPQLAADERTMLGEFLDYHRATLIGKLAGLEREQAVRRVVPSLTTLLGLVKHLVDVEHCWFSVVFAGGPDESAFMLDEDPDAEFRIRREDEIDGILDLYTRECERSRAVVAAAHSLDQVARMDSMEHTLRWILIHMIEETARHNGHADILRELIDGATGE